MAADDGFNIEKVHRLFCDSVADDDTIDLDGYVNGYDELSKMFGILGSVFGFVVSDVVEKIGILRDYRKSEEAEHYKTVQSMLQYEVDQGTTDNKKKASGSRTLLRLHRAMEFTARLMKDVKNAEQDAKMSKITSTAYDATLSKHHPWLIRKSVGLAVHMLSSRQHLIEKMNIEDEETASCELVNAANIQEKLFSIIEDLYTKYDLHSLP